MNQNGRNVGELLLKERYDKKKQKKNNHLAFQRNLQVQQNHYQIIWKKIPNFFLSIKDNFNSFKNIICTSYFLVIFCFRVVAVVMVVSFWCQKYK